MRSSQASVASTLELPPVVAADRAVAGMGVLAGAFVGWLLARQGLAVAALLAGFAGVTFAVIHVALWTRSRRLPALRLEHRTDGSVWLSRAGQDAVPATVGLRTRLIGPSVFLDVSGRRAGSDLRYLRWLTPLDVPPGTLRRWSVVLPCSGRDTRS